MNNSFEFKICKMILGNEVTYEIGKKAEHSLSKQNIEPLPITFLTKEQVSCIIPAKKSSYTK